MATQRYISTSFWDDEWIHRLDPSEKLMYMYLMTNTLTNIAGVYKISDERMVFDTGFNETTVRNIMDKFQKAGKCYFHQGWVILPSWPKHQKWQNKKTIKEGIEIILIGLPTDIKSLLLKIPYAYPMDTISGFMDSTRYQPSYIYSDSDSDSNLDRDKIPATEKFDDEQFEDPVPTPPKPAKLFKPVKSAYGILKNVFLTDREYSGLVERYGKEITDRYIDKISTWIPNAKESQKPKDFNATIHNWIARDKERGTFIEPKQIIQHQPKTYQPCGVCGTIPNPQVVEAGITWCKQCGEWDFAKGSRRE